MERPPITKECILCCEDKNVELFRVYPCCGQSICSKCSTDCLDIQGTKCPMCRQSTLMTDKQAFESLITRSKKHDPGALSELAQVYMYGHYGQKVDLKRALVYFKLAAKFGDEYSKEIVEQLEERKKKSSVKKKLKKSRRKSARKSRKRRSSK